MTKIPVMIATPMRSFPGMDKMPEHYQQLCNDLAYLTNDPDCPYSFQIAFCEGGLGRARNKIVAEAMKQNVKWLMWLDDDLMLIADNILTLLSHKKPVVGALYCTREKRSHWVANFMHDVELQKGGLLQVIEVGIGSKLYHMDVFKELARLYPQIAYTDRDSGERMHGFFQHCVITTDLKPDGDLISEDFFCDYLCRMVKMAIWVDTGIKLKHVAADGTTFPLDNNWPPIPGIEEGEV